MNKRAHTQDRPVIDNRPFTIAVSHEYGTEQSGHYYRRQLQDGTAYTGPIKGARS